MNFLSEYIIHEKLFERGNINNRSALRYFCHVLLIKNKDQIYTEKYIMVSSLQYLLTTRIKFYEQ